MYAAVHLSLLPSSTVVAPEELFEVSLSLHLDDKPVELPWALQLHAQQERNESSHTSGGDEGHNDQDQGIRHVAKTNWFKMEDGGVQWKISVPSAGVYSFKVFASTPCDPASMGAEERRLADLLLEETDSQSEFPHKCSFQLKSAHAHQLPVFVTTKTFRLLVSVANYSTPSASQPFQVRVEAKPLRDTAAGREAFDGRVSIFAISAEDRYAFPRVLSGETELRAKDGVAVFSNLMFLVPGKYKLVATAANALFGETETIESPVAPTRSLR